MSGAPASLDGLVIGVTGARKGAELATTLQRRGARVLHGPTLAGDVAADATVLVAALDDLVARPPHLFAASTGMGMRLLADVAEQRGRTDEVRGALRGAEVLARGAKARGGLGRFGVVPGWTAPDELDRQVADELRRRAGPADVVVVQAHGAGGRVYDRLADDGLDVRVVRPYVSAPLADPAPAAELVAAIAGGHCDVVVLTSPGAVHGLADVAAAEGRLDAVTRAMREDGATVVAAVGPVTTAAVEEHGWAAGIVPGTHRTGALVRAMEAWAAR